jgi:hypothetical protein
LKPRILIFWVLILTAGLALWWTQRKPQTPAAAPTVSPAAVSAPEPEISVPSPVPPTPVSEPPVPLVPPTITLEDQKMALDAIDNLDFTFRDYASALGGNPVGTNAEITAALLGDNLKQLKLAIPVGSSQNDQAELCDPWGSPWFFHQLSGSKMEIRSAGPDRALYTTDDFVR